MKKNIISIRPNTTNRSSDRLHIFFHDLSKIELLSAKEELILCKKIHDGDEKALQELCTKNLRFVVSIAKQYQHHGIPLADLINEGSIGLIKAAQKFDYTRGFKFISFAVRWIRQSIQEAVYKQAKIIKLPNHQCNAIRSLNRMTQQLEQQFGRLPTQEELAQALDLSMDDFLFLQTLANTSIDLLDDHINDGGNASFIEHFHIGNENNIANNINHEENSYIVNQLLTILDPGIQTMFKMKYGITPYTHEHTDGEIAEELQTTAIKIQRAMTNATSYIKKYKKNKKLQQKQKRRITSPSPINIPNEQEIPVQTNEKKIQTNEKHINNSSLDTLKHELLCDISNEQWATIVQMKYCLPPYTCKYENSEIAQKLNIPVYHVTEILEHSIQKIVSNKTLAPAILQLISTFKEYDQLILNMKYGFGSSLRPTYTDLEIANQISSRVSHVQYVITTFENKLRNLVFAPQLTSQ